MRTTATTMVLAAALALGGCGAVVQGIQQSNFEKKAAEVQKQVDAIEAECVAKFPKKRGQMTNRTRCRQPMVDLYQSIGLPADLLRLQYASALVVAEKVDNGTLTEAQGELEFAQLNSQITAEMQRRNLAGRSVMADEAIAAEASRANTINTLNNIQRSINGPPTVTCTHQPGAVGYPATTTCR